MIMTLAIMVSCSSESAPEESDEGEAVMEEELTGYVLHVEEKRF